MCICLERNRKKEAGDTGYNGGPWTMFSFSAQGLRHIYVVLNLLTH
jgi:hypothetical protein